MGAAQLVVVSGPHDLPKRRLLNGAGLYVVSEWFTTPMTSETLGTSRWEDRASSSARYAAMIGSPLRGTSGFSWHARTQMTLKCRR